MIRLTLLSLLPLIITLASCVENAPEPVDKSSIIAGTDSFGKTYSITTIEVALGTLQPHQCLTDNFITYFPNGNYEVNEGATKCNPNDPPALVGTWTLNQDQSQLLGNIDGSVQNWMIESLDRRNHRISSLFEEGERIYTLTTSN